MSIPKEPRQLMINLMYLVLTALLALNVSAEVLNAFLDMDSSLSQTGVMVNATNNRMADAIVQHAEAYPKFEAFKTKTESLRKTTAPFYQKIEKIKKELIEKSGGLDEKGKPKGIRNKDITTRLFVKEGGGTKIKEDFFQIRKSLFELIDEPADRERVKEKLPTKVGVVPDDSDKNSWEEYAFSHMPVAAVLPLLTKIQNDIQTVETAILNRFFAKMNVEDKVDAYVPVIAADKTYVIRGEEYAGEIFLASYNSSIENVKVRVDGRPLSVVDGKAKFRTNPRTTGEKKHKLEMEITNPLTGEAQTFRKDFSYEVGERSAAVSADKMNVFYVAVENPISVSVAGVPSEQVKVSGTNVELKKTSGGKYIAIPRTPGEATITVSGGGMKPTKFDYRVKKIPDPVLRLSAKSGGKMTAAEMRIQKGVIPFLDFDFDARCRVVSFQVARVPKNGDAVFTNNNGGRFEASAQRIIDQAKRGDSYFFNEVYVKCPGDVRRREIPGMVFSIK